MDFNLFGKKNKETQEATNTPAATPTTSATPGLLNLKKDDILDLTKTSTNLNSLKLSAGWDVQARGRDYDLDLFALLVNGDNKLTKQTNACVYYGEKNAKGIYLDGDNLTGEGDGDDENIFINLGEIPADVSKIILAVAIYEAKDRGQQFSNVKDAYVRLVDTSGRREEEVCRYNLSNDGGDNTAVIAAEIFRTGSGWSFKAVGEYTKGSISKIEKNYK